MSSAIRVLSILASIIVAAPAAAQVTHVVAVSGSEFNPSTLTIEAGDTVEWQNTGGCHNVAETTPSGPAGFGSGAVACAPWIYSFTFTAAGEYTYHCDAHFTFGMVGSITVLPSTANEDLPETVVHLDLTPNPFSDRLALSLGLDRDADVRAIVLDLAGRELAVLYDGRVVAGRSLEAVWVPTAATPAGTYVVRIVGDTFTDSRRVLLVR
jgi:plastocyanin